MEWGEGQWTVKWPTSLRSCKEMSLKLEAIEERVTYGTSTSLIKWESMGVFFAAGWEATIQWNPSTKPTLHLWLPFTIIYVYKSEGRGKTTWGKSSINKGQGTKFEHVFNISFSSLEWVDRSLVKRILASEKLIYLRPKLLRTPSRGPHSQYYGEKRLKMT